MYKISELAGIAGVSVRTLQYYDEKGLLSPAEVSPNGYRLYGEKELEYLQQILLYKELGYSLSQIRQILYAPGFDLERSLVQQKLQVEKRLSRLTAVIRNIEKTLSTVRGETKMKDRERFEGLDVDAVLKEQEQYVEEVNRNYDENLVEESRKRTSNYSKGKWEEIMKEGLGIAADIAKRMEAGAAIDDPAVQESVKAYHEHINRNFYTCSIEVFKGLGQLYVSDERFTAHYEKIADGLAGYLSRAIDHYCSERE